MMEVAARFKYFFSNDVELAKESSIGLDLIRGISAQMVLIGHALSFYQIYPSKPSHAIFYMQNLGVLVFFIMSGFLITLTTRKKALESAKYGFAEYFFDRFIRIFSAYLPAIIFVLVIDLVAAAINPAGFPYWDAINLKTFIGNIFMFQDFPDIKHTLPEFLRLTSFGSARPFWTIAIEWWFYMFFGWVFFFKKIKLNIVLKILVLFFVIIIPAYNLRGGRADCLTYLWYAGFIMSYVYNSDFVVHLKKFIIIIMLALLGLVFMYFVRKLDLKVYNYQVGGIVAAVILLLIALFPKISPIFASEMGRKLIKLVADFSFSLYLLHYTILNLLHNALGFYTEKPWIGFLLSVVICNIIALVFAYFTEFHHKQLRKHFFNRYKV